jgi:NTP pyrophosphatase (non-canonical NTP hydrolase)
MAMTGKFEDIYQLQIAFQKEIIKKYQSHLSDGNIPADNPEMLQYHTTALVEEIGEILKADKRWKTHRNDAFDPENKLEEVADAYITLMNISIHSGYHAEQLMDVIEKKINRNIERMIVKTK